MANLELYKIFMIVAKEENLTKASERLYISQPAVTKHIKNLEEALNTKLFVRSNHGIRLTEQGQKIYDEIKNSMNEMIQLDQKYTNKTRDINLGAHNTLLTKILGESISNYYKENIDSKINTFNLENKEMIRKLEDKEIDIIFSKKLKFKYDEKKIKYIKLGYWHDVLIANHDSKWKGKVITIEDLKNENFYMPRKKSETLRNFFNSVQSNYADFKQIRHITYRAIVDILKDVEGIGLITKEFLEEELEKNQMVLLETDFKIEPIEYGIYLNKDNKFEQLVQLIQIIKSMTKKDITKSNN